LSLRGTKQSLMHFGFHELTSCTRLTQRRIGTSLGQVDISVTLAGAMLRRGV
jgi:hypothetical protein